MKPDNIGENDWNLVLKKYSDNIDYVIKKLNDDYPIQYLIGNVDFCYTNLKVTEDCLIPRFETEYLVEKTINRLKKYNSNTLNIIDIGTGSGCIIINLACKLEQKFTGIDVSKKALEIAKYNAKANNVLVDFKKVDILAEDSLDNYDVIISNPPYVSFMESVDNATKYEPQNAIFANNDGLEFYEHIINIINNKPKLIAFEIGCNQGEKIKDIVLNKFPDANISIEKDLCKRDRYVFVEFN
jgi:release factor glutamine methyltransferase